MARMAVQGLMLAAFTLYSHVRLGYDFRNLTILLNGRQKEGIGGRNPGMGLNEADTRAKLIDPGLHARGWTEEHIRRSV